MTITSQEVLPVKPAHANSALPWYLRDLYKYLLTFAGMTFIYVGFRIYQGAFGVSAGLDSTEPAFDTHWMRLLYIEAIFLAIVFPALWGYLWFTRDRNLDAIAPKEEITHYFTMTMWISIYTFAVYWAGSYFAEQDNSWHQVSIRDTPFTANHIIEFYFNFPFYVLLGPGSMRGRGCRSTPRAFRCR
jgi:methane/ammonia monooxygenase subunit C